MADIEEVEGGDSDFYTVNLTPKNATSEWKSGVTITGSTEEYLSAHKKLMDMMSKKGERFVINGVEIAILDNPTNKPVAIEVKPGTGMSGKTNLKIFGLNSRGGATITITKIRGMGFEYSKHLAYKVVKHLLDGWISGKLTEDDVESFKKKKPDNTKSDAPSLSKSVQGMKLHMKRIHDNKPKFVECQFCDKNFVEEEELLKHNGLEHKIQDKRKIEDDDCITLEEIELDGEDVLQCLENESWEETRFSFLKSKETKQNSIPEGSMEVDEDIKNRIKFNDEKVLIKQKNFDEQEEIYNEVKRKLGTKEKDEEKKRKRQMSMEKKKNRKKSKKETVKNCEEKKEKLKDINMKYKDLFLAVGLEIEQHCSYSENGDGACGGNCTALHFHLDETQDVRMIVNEHLVRFWPYYQPFVIFPFSQTAGSENVPFENEEEFLRFLKHDKGLASSGWRITISRLSAISTKYLCIF